jgi:chromosome segregation ATPase
LFVDSLLFSLQHALGADFAPDVRQAWKSLLVKVVEPMSGAIRAVVVPSAATSQANDVTRKDVQPTPFAKSDMGPAQRATALPALKQRTTRPKVQERPREDRLDRKSSTELSYALVSEENVALKTQLRKAQQQNALLKEKMRAAAREQQDELAMSSLQSGPEVARLRAALLGKQQESQRDEEELRSLRDQVRGLEREKNLLSRRLDATSQRKGTQRGPGGSDDNYKTQLVQRNQELVSVRGERDSLEKKNTKLEQQVVVLTRKQDALRRQFQKEMVQLSSQNSLAGATRSEPAHMNRKLGQLGKLRRTGSSSALGQTAGTVLPGLKKEQELETPAREASKRDGRFSARARPLSAANPKRTIPRPRNQYRRPAQQPSRWR